MAEEKKISFSASDNGISSFMKKLQADSKALFGDLAKEAQKQSTSQKEQLKIIEAQIKALERQNNLEKEQNKIILERKRNAGVINEKQYAAQLFQDRDDARGSGVQNKILHDLLEEMKSSNKEEEKPKKVEATNTFASVLAAGLVRDIFGLIKQTSSAKTGLDLLAPAAGIMGGITGGAAGAGLDLLNASVLGTGAGKSTFGLLGAQAGKDIGGLAGELYTRHLTTKDQYDQQYLKYRATTGMNGGTSNLASMGFDLPAVAAMMNQVAQSGGTGKGARRNADTVLGLSRGYGVDEGAALGSIGLQRMGGGNGSANMQRSLGIAIAEGLDRAKFSDVIRTQTTLMQQFAATSTHPSASAANQMMFEYNRMGGAFGIGDPRSLGKISAMSEGMANPGTDFDKAMSYSILRQLNPNDDIWSLIGKQEKAGQDPAYRKAFMNKAMNLTGSESINKLLLHGRSGFDLGSGINAEDIDTLFKGSGNIGSMTGKMSGYLGSKKIKSEAEEFTSHLQKNQAEVTNAFVSGFMDGTKAIAVQFEGEMKVAISNIVDYWTNKFMQQKIDTHNKPPLKVSYQGKKPDKNGKLSMSDQVTNGLGDAMTMGF